MTKRALAIAVVALALVAAACGDDDDSTSTAKDTGGAQTVGIQVDAKSSETQVAFTQYFPSKVTVHPGDTVDFTGAFTGEPHTVTFGTLVDEGLAKVDPNSEDEPPELQKMPALIPDGGGDAVQSSAQPCFLATGAPPESDACPKVAQPDFDGTQAVYSSGFLADGEHFKVKLSDSIMPGTYSFFCELHRASMSGKVTVVAADVAADTAAKAKTALQTELDAALAKIKPAMDAIRKGTLPTVIETAEPGSVIAGGFSDAIESAVPVLFGPDNTSIKAGDTVTWTVVGPHTISFAASEALRTFITKSPDGSVHINPDSFAPAGGAGQPQPDENAAPPAENAPPVVIDGGSYNGTGFHSSGLILSFGQPVYQYKMKFTKAGSYDYVCLIHPDMKGVINVT